MITPLAKYDSKEIGLIGHTICNYPSAELARQLIDIMVSNQVKLIELQIPFTEPMADGPTFMHANHDAIAQGVTVEQCFELMSEVSSKYPIPFVFMTYANIVYHMGYEKFVLKAKKAGAYGAIIPDLPPDLAEDYLAICTAHDFASIQIFPPNITAERLPILAKASTGFNYVVARAGVTGEKTRFEDALIDQVATIRQHNDLPIAVGFGVQNKEDLEYLKPIADYAIIGTKALKVFQEQGIAGVKEFWRGMNTRHIWTRP